MGMHGKKLGTPEFLRSPSSPWSRGVFSWAGTRPGEGAGYGGDALPSRLECSARVARVAARLTLRRLGLPKPAAGWTGDSDLGHLDLRGFRCPPTSPCTGEGQRRGAARLGRRPGSRSRGGKRRHRRAPALRLPRRKLRARWGQARVGPEAPTRGRVGSAVVPSGGRPRPCRRRLSRGSSCVSVAAPLPLGPLCLFLPKTRGVEAFRGGSAGDTPPLGEACSDPRAVGWRLLPERLADHERPSAWTTLRTWRYRFEQTASGCLIRAAERQPRHGRVRQGTDNPSVPLAIPCLPPSHGPRSLCSSGRARSPGWQHPSPPPRLPLKNQPRV